MKTIFQLLSSIIVLLTLSGCHAPDATILRPVTQLSPGMTKSETIAIMGTPVTSMSPGNGIEVLKYVFRQPRGLLKSTLRTEYHVRLVHDDETKQAAPNRVV